MEFAIIVLIAVMSPLLRSFCLPRDFELSDCRFWMFLILSLAANWFAFLGFHELTNNHAISNGDYSTILEILALLSAGAIAGFWAIEYKDAALDETHILNIISAIFVLVFYVLFFSICSISERVRIFIILRIMGCSGNNVSSSRNQRGD